MSFKKVNPRQNFPELEENILKFWEKDKTFKKSVKGRQKSKSFSFYDGPPYATGTPHYGHILAGTIKDVIPRYWTMKGYRIERRFGWDCHGLPVEYEKEKELGFKSKHDIEEYGVGKFNEACRSTVLKYVDEWRRTIIRSGRWVDFDNDYKTMTPEFMESVWWVFKSLWDKELIYEGFKVNPYCPRCATPLASFETALGYADKEDIAVTVRFQLAASSSRFAGDSKKSQPTANSKLPAFILAWTTTPWTLPGNLLLAVSEKVKYAVMSNAKEKVILAKDRLEAYAEELKGYKKVNEISGKDLIGKKYEPIFPFYKNTEGAFRIVSADFVSTEDGTGIVHIAPSFGVDDYNVGKKESIDFVFPVEDDGTYNDEVKDYTGLQVYDVATNSKIADDLEKKGKVFKHEHIKHSYPFCWRCETPLIYKTVTTWFVDVQRIKKDMISELLDTRWVPLAARNRMEKMMEVAPDWNITRNRFWGTPIPVWQCECGEVQTFGSIKDLEKASGKKITDIHKHYVDKIKIPCKCGGKAERTPEILDVWFDSGSMPYASHHYPFENKKEFEERFPADFIAEGIDQTRGWFNTLLVLSTSIFGKTPYKNVVVNGTVLAEDGKKMSKRLKNYPEPDLLMHEYGADSMRFYLMNSPAVRAEDLRFSERGVSEVVKKLVLTLWNSYSFFVTYANIDKFKIKKIDIKKRALLDKWIISKLNTLTKEVKEEMDNYDLLKATRPFWNFMDDLSNWYIRRSRRRFWKSENDGDKLSAYQTLYEVLTTLSQLMAPFMPFVTEEVYLGLTGGEKSVHLTDWPIYDKKNINAKLEDKMANVREIVEKGLSERSKKAIKVRQPLARCMVKGVKSLGKELENVVKEELNVKKLELKDGKTLTVKLDTKITKDLKLEGTAREIVRKIQSMRKDADFDVADRIKIFVDTDSKEIKEVFEKFDSYIRKETLAKEVNFELHKDAEEAKIGSEKLAICLEKI